MRVRYDRDTCIGMFQCVEEWGAFERNMDAGKADLDGATEVEPGVYEAEIQADAELDAEFAARACPVDAIAVYDDDGEQVV